MMIMIIMINPYDSLIIMMIVMMTSCWRRAIAMLFDTLRPREGSDLAIKVVMVVMMVMMVMMMVMMMLMMIVMIKNTVMMMMMIQIEPSGAKEAAKKER